MLKFCLSIGIPRSSFKRTCGHCSFSGAIATSCGPYSKLQLGGGGGILGRALRLLPHLESGETARQSEGWRSSEWVEDISQRSSAEVKFSAKRSASPFFNVNDDAFMTSPHNGEWTWVFANVVFCCRKYKHLPASEFCCATSGCRTSRPSRTRRVRQTLVGVSVPV